MNKRRVWRGIVRYEIAPKPPPEDKTVSILDISNIKGSPVLVPMSHVSNLNWTQ